MPGYKITREDIIRPEEFNELLEKCGKAPKPDRLRCIVVLLWLFGKRINEILRLRREELSFESGYFCVKFHVGKKKRKVVSGVELTQTKRIKEQNPYVQKYVKPYIEKFDQGYIFPSYSGPTIRRVIMDHSKVEKDVVVLPDSKVYEYRKEGGYLTAARVRQLLKEANPAVWPHLFRHSLAVRMCEGIEVKDKEGRKVKLRADVAELMGWFDWETAQVAMGYVKDYSQKMTEPWSERDI